MTRTRTLATAALAAAAFILMTALPANAWWANSMSGSTPSPAGGEVIWTINYKGYDSGARMTTNLTRQNSGIGANVCVMDTLNGGAGVCVGTPRGYVFSDPVTVNSADAYVYVTVCPDTKLTRYCGPRQQVYLRR